MTQRSVQNTGLEQLDGPVGHIVHIGAGRGGDLPRWLAMAPQAVVLVDPDPAAAMALNAAADGDARVKVIEAAISDDPQAGALNRFGFAELNSLRSPTGLKQLFPGLESPRHEDVELRHPKALIERLKLDAQARNLLIIEAPGEVMAIITALQEAGLLALFAGLKIQTGRESLYEGAAPLADILKALTQAGFEALDAPHGDDPDRPEIELRRIGAATTAAPEAQKEASSEVETPPAVAEPENEVAKEDVAKAPTPQLVVDASKHDALKQKIAAHKAEATKARRAKGVVQGQLTRKEKAFAEQATQLEEANSRIAALEKELAAKDADREAAQSALTAAQARDAEQVAELDRRGADFAKLQGTHATTLTELENHKAKTTELQALADTRTKERDAALTDLKEARARAQTALDAALARDAEQLEELENRGADFAKLKGEHEATLSALESQKNKTAEVQGLADAAQSTLKTAQTQSAAELEKRGADFAQLKEAHDVVLKDLESARKKTAEMRDLVDARTKTRNTAVNDLQEVRKQLEAAQEAAGEAAAQHKKREGDMATQTAALKQEATTLRTERDTLRTQLETAQAQIETGKQRDGQLAMSREEMLRAEGQIELIKDLLLRGPDL